MHDNAFSVKPEFTGGEDRESPRDGRFSLTGMNKYAIMRYTFIGRENYERERQYHL